MGLFHIIAIYDISKFIDCDLVNRKKKNPKSIDNVD